MDPDYLPFHPSPSRPHFAVPKGAVDAHCHVFGPASAFPYAKERKYTPCDAPKEKLFALRDFLGFERNVIVQATCHGNDNRALVDALAHSDDRGTLERPGGSPSSRLCPGPPGVPGRLAGGGGFPSTWQRGRGRAGGREPVAGAFLSFFDFFQNHRAKMAPRLILVRRASQSRR